MPISNWENSELIDTDWALSEYIINEYRNHRSRLYFSALIRSLMLVAIWVVVIYSFREIANIVIGTIISVLLYTYIIIEFLSTRRRARRDYEFMMSLKENRDKFYDRNT